MDFSGLTKSSDLGLFFAAADQQARPTTFAARQDNISVGWTAPVSTYEKMRAINLDADRLDRNMNAFVSNVQLRADFNAWLANWRVLFNKYAGPDATFGDKFWLGMSSERSDALAQQAAEEDMRLRGFYALYNRERQPNGQPVPNLVDPPVLPPSPSGPLASVGLPWWFWMVAGVGVVGLGYLGYRKYQEGKAKAGVAKKFGRGALTKYLGPMGEPAYEYSQAGRDVGAPNFQVGRDPAAPFQLATYARDPLPFRDATLFEERAQRIPPARPARMVRDADYDFDDEEGDF
jgi:hypothetical protein